MKMIVAVIKPSRLDAVLEAVTRAGATGLTVTEVRGYGRQKGKTEIYRGAEYEVKLLPKVAWRSRSRTISSTAWSRRSSRRPTPARSATARSSSWTCSPPCASAPASATWRR